MRKLIARISILLVLLFLVACDRGVSQQDGEPEGSMPVVVSDPAPSKAQEPLKPADDVPSLEADDAPTPEDVGDAADGHAENDEESAHAEPTDSSDKKVEVRAIPFDALQFPSELPKGRVDGGLAFIDQAGVNHVVFTLDVPFSRDHIRSTTLHIKHVVENDGVAREVRSYIERIHDCDFDVIVKPYYGEWSISDIDNNGIGEVSFAYTADCVSDISPFVHKAFITEGGKKYALRGFTVRHYPDDYVEGGSYTADTMPPLFLKKVKKVWHRTSQE